MNAAGEKQSVRGDDERAILLRGHCLENFIEMRDLVGSRAFLLKKRWEVFLHKLLPKWYLPLYTLVTFTCTPYAEALRRAKKQDRIVGAGIMLLMALLVGLLVWFSFL